MAKEKKSVWERNFAEDSKIRELVAAHFVPRMKQVRKDRMLLQEHWLRFFNMWNVTKDGYHPYQGRAQLYIPEVRKNVEAQARQMTEAAFPNEDFFDVSPGLTGTKKGAQAWKSIHRWAIENSKLRHKYHVAMRQEAMLGTSPIYIPWNKIERHEFRSKRLGKKVSMQKQKVEIYNGPDFVVRDLFKWYAFNPKKQDILEDGCFEDLVVSPNDLTLREKQGLLFGKDKILGGNSNAYLMEELIKDVQRAEAMGLLIQNNTAYAGEAYLRPDNVEDQRDASFMCTVVFANVILPEACEDDEDPELPIAVKIEIYDNEHVGLIQRNPFAHQRPPYVIGKYILPNADEFYGQGIPWATQYQQYEINSKAEQAMDSTTLALNPIAIVDPGLAGTNNEFNAEPGAVWWANPQGVKFAAMPDVAPAGYAAITQLRAQMQDYSDRSPALPPQLLGKSRTATQSAIVNDTMSIDNKTFQLQNEQMILEPMMEMWESLTDQNMQEDQMVMILGRRAADLKRTLISKADLLGRYRYFWKASSTMQNRQIMGRQMLDFMKVITMLPPQFLSGTPINYPELVRTLWTEAFQMPPSDADKILGQPEEMVTQDAIAENKMAEMGFELEVLPGDDDHAHMQIHDQALMKLSDGDPKKILLIAHQLEHKKQSDKKAAMLQAQQQQMQLQILQASRGRVDPGAGTPTAPGASHQAPAPGSPQRSPGSGNRAQLSPNATPGNMGSGIRP